MSDFFLFGSGDAIFTPTRDADGIIVPVATPIALPSCIDIGIEKKGTVKLHEGKYQYSLAAAIAKRAITVTLTCNMHNAKSLSVSTNESVLPSFVQMYMPPTAQAIPAAPGQIVATPPSSGVYKADMGVSDSLGNVLTRVASAPATGQYSLVEATGTYTFAAADAGTQVYIRYTYSVASGGHSVAEYNRLQGVAPEYSLTMTSGKYRGVQVLFEAPIATVTDTSQPFKNGDFMAQKITVDVLANPVTGLVFTSSIPI